MKHTPFVADYLHPVSGTVHAEEPLHRIRQYARSGGFYSLIVVDQNKPVGMIRWLDIDPISTIPDSSLARDIMLAGSPALTQRTPVLEAEINLNVTRMDRLPVVDAEGELVGVYASATLKDWIRMDDDSNDNTFHDFSGGAPVRQAFTVHPGMNVYASDGDLVGLVDRLFLEAGAVVGFLVAYDDDDGPHKYLSLDAVEELFDETVILAVTAAAFDRLPDAAAGQA